MNNIGDYLKRFTKLEPSDRRVKRAVSEAVSEITGVIVGEDDLKVSGKTVFLNIHPTAKTEIFFKKKKILNQLEDTLGREMVNNLV